MGWRYSRRVTLFPGIRLNISKSGVSTTFGVPGASINIGRNGAYINTGIPGTGFYARTKIGGNGPDVQPSEDNSARFFVPKDFHSSIRPDVTEFTSPGLQVFHEIVSGVLQERRFLSWELDSAQRKYAEAKQKLDKINWIPFIERIVPNVVKERKDDVVDAQESIEEIKKQIRECRAKLDLSFESRASEEKWNDIVRTVGELQYSNCIWNIVSERRVDRAATRSSADREVERVKASVYRQSLDFLDSNQTFPTFVNSIEDRIVLMPGFVATLSKDEKFAFLDWSDISISFARVSFTETERVPSDSQVAEMTWRYVNKNGSQDMRFSNNYEIPIVRYADIIFESKAGMREVFMFSHFDRAKAFQTSIDTYLRDLKGNPEGQHSRGGTRNNGPTGGNEGANGGKKPEPNDVKSQSNLEVLGLKNGATQESIREAYIRLLRQYHPDKVASLGPEFIRLAEEKTKEINRAYGELCK